jgi:vacuolar-type H+-ATPase subunit H
MIENSGTLEHLLKVEAEAAALVAEAQAEADRRLHDAEEKNRSSYEERYKAEVQKLEAFQKQEEEKCRQQYAKEIEDYKKELSSVTVDENKFFTLFNEYLAARG